MSENGIGDELLRDLLKQIDRDARQEREEISRYLHDDPLQLLSAAVLRLRVLRGRLGDESGDELDEIESLVRRGLEGVRTTSRRLGELSARRYGLAGALERLVRRQADRLDLSVESEVDPAVMPSDPELATLLCEAVSDLLLDAAGAEAGGTVRLCYGLGAEGELEIEIGTPPSRARPETAHDKSASLEELQEALRAFDTRLETATVNGAGARLRFVVPAALVDGPSTR